MVSLKILYIVPSASFFVTKQKLFAANCVVVAVFVYFLIILTWFFCLAGCLNQRVLLLPGAACPHEWLEEQPHRQVPWLKSHRCPGSRGPKPALSVATWDATSCSGKTARANRSSGARPTPATPSCTNRASATSATEALNVYIEGIITHRRPTYPLLSALLLAYCFFFVRHVISLNIYHICLALVEHKWVRVYIIWQSTTKHNFNLCVFFFLPLVPSDCSYTT